MELRERASRSFILLRAWWSVDAGRRALLGRSVTHVVVHRQDGDADRWHLLRFGDAISLLARADGTSTLGEALSLAGTPGATVADVDQAESVTGPAILLAGGAPVGILVPEAPARPTTRGTRRGLPPPSAPAPATDGPAATSRRSLEAEFPDSVPAGVVEWLLVSLSAAEATAHGVAVDVAEGDELDILVQPRRGFEVEGDDRGTIVVPASGESMPLQFKLKAIDEGPGIIRVLAFRRGEPLGMIALNPTVTPAAAVPTVRGRTATAPRKRRAKALAPSSPQIPDLTAFIEERERGGTIEYLIRLSATDPGLGLNLKPYGPFQLKLDPSKFFETFFAEIEALPLDTPEEQATADRRVAAKGAELSRMLFPADLQAKLWDVRDSITSVIVQSEEPWIPWEMCKLFGKEGERLVDGPFLSEKYTITRWRPGIEIKRPLTLRNIALVVPPDSGLPLATQERDFVLSLAGPERKVTLVPGTFADVQDAFIAGTYDGFHFTGHGVAQDANPNRSSIILTGELPFTPEDVSGAAANVGIPRPFMFMNACQVGRSGMGLTGVGGWANRLVEDGAAAFVGAYWSVFDEPAFGFAKELYTRILRGVPIGEAVRDARLAVRSPGDPSWLAYTVFADPLATVAS